MYSRIRNLFYEYYNYYFENDLTIIPILELNKVQILGASLNETIDATMTLLYELYYKKKPRLSSIAEELSVSFETFEVIVLLHGKLVQFTFNDVNDTIDFQYGISWCKYNEKSRIETMKKIGHLLI